MTLKILPGTFSICQVATMAGISLDREFCFVGKTDEELSVVCATEDVPNDVIACEDGWRAFRIEGVLDFSLVGILSKITGVLADRQIGIFAVSTFRTDYILVKQVQLEAALRALTDAGYCVVSQNQQRMTEQ